MSRIARLAAAVTIPLALFVWQWWAPFAPPVLRWHVGWFTLLAAPPLAVAWAVWFLRFTAPSASTTAPEGR